MASFGYLQRRGRGTVGKRGGMGRKGEDMGGI